jgi:hypothetical protein
MEPARANGKGAESRSRERDLSVLLATSRPLETPPGHEGRVVDLGNPALDSGLGSAPARPAAVLGSRNRSWRSPLRDAPRQPGGLDAETLSLHVLTLVLGALDSVNHCAFFVLLVAPEWLAIGATAIAARRLDQAAPARNNSR